MIPLLVVDDSNTVRLMLQGWLTEAGYDVKEASNGTQALEILRASEDRLIVLLDYQMPDLDGFEVLRHAADEGLIPPRCAYIAISSMAENFPPEFSALLRQHGVQILPKPFDRDTLLHVIQFVAERLNSVTAQ